MSLSLGNVLYTEGLRSSAVYLGEFLGRNLGLEIGYLIQR